ncbi:MAG: amidohydrolase family protein [Deltaproteobacteria bacterium]|nr:amidohydrolase family protein [Deltaproteobacteria bacterium]
MSIIDFHIHVTLASEYSPWLLEELGRRVPGDPSAYLDRVLGSPRGFEEFLDAHGVDVAVCLAEQNPRSTGACSNDRVAEFCRGSARLIPFASVNPVEDPDPAGEVERAVTRLGMRGLKLYPVYQGFFASDRRLYPVYAKAEELGVPVLVHTGSSVLRDARIKYGDPLHLDDVAVDFPRLTIVMAHGGRGFWYDRAFFLARIHERVFLEISGLPPSKLLEYFPELERIADKVVFGSDWPDVTDVGANVKAVGELPLADDTKTRILGGNAARILGLTG